MYILETESCMASHLDFVSPFASSLYINIINLIILNCNKIKKQQVKYDGKKRDVAATVFETN